MSMRGSNCSMEHTTCANGWMDRMDGWNGESQQLYLLNNVSCNRIRERAPLRTTHGTFKCCRFQLRQSKGDFSCFGLNLSSCLLLAFCLLGYVDNHQIPSERIVLHNPPRKNQALSHLVLSSRSGKITSTFLAACFPKV